MTAERTVILVGAGARAAAWAQAFEAAGAQVAAVVSRRAAGRDALGLAAAWRTDALDAALERFPQARVAVALPPRAAVEAGLVLARAGRSALLEAPLDGETLLEAREAALRASASLRVAHGWVTVPGVGWLREVLAGRQLRRMELEVRGLPETGGGGLAERLPHAVALVRRLAPGARVRSARLDDEATLVVAWEGAAPLMLKVSPGAPALELNAETVTGRVALRAAEDWQEAAVERPGGAWGRKRQAWASGATAIAAELLAPESLAGDTLADAVEVATLVQDVERALGRRLPPSQRGFAVGRASSAQAHGEVRRVDGARDGGAAGGSPPLRNEAVASWLERVGLRGPLPAASAVSALALPAERLPIELVALRAGLKPVVFLTLRPEQVDATLQAVSGYHVERVERRVAVGAQDVWDDRRDRGEPRVELYISKDRALAERARALQVEDPSRSLEALGGLLGYPPCCVAAFARQVDRANNTYTRYAIAARTAPGPWPWELNELSARLIEFFPCSYRCDAALTYARRVFAQLEQDDAAYAAAVRDALARTWLYFEHDAWLTVDARRVEVAPGAPAGLRPLAGALRAGDELVLTATRLEVRSDGEPRFSLARTDPGLGLLARFA